MRRWLSERFVVIGIVAAVLDVCSRILSRLGLDYLAWVAVQRSWDFEYSTRIGQAMAIIDIAATMLWWAFIFALAFRILERLEHKQTI